MFDDIKHQPYFGCIICVSGTLGGHTGMPKDMPLGTRLSSRWGAHGSLSSMEPQRGPEGVSAAAGLCLLGGHRPLTPERPQAA